MKYVLLQHCSGEPAVKYSTLNTELCHSEHVIQYLVHVTNNTAHTTWFRFN